MKNKISSIVFLFLRQRRISLWLACLLIFLFTGCQFKESYSMQYGFTNEIITQTLLELKDGGVKIEIPFADFGCEPKSYKAVLERKEKDFVLTISGTETEKRCPFKFWADISGIPAGDFWLKVIYDKAGEKQEVFYQPFSIAK